MTAWLGTLALYEHRAGVEVVARETISFDVARGEAHFGPVEIDGHALTWELTPGDAPIGNPLLSHAVVLEAADTSWIARCDRIDFPPGGIAYTHTHPGPGIRYLLAGTLTIRSEGQTTEYAAGEPWYEAGPGARARDRRRRSRVRVRPRAAAARGVGGQADDPLRRSRRRARSRSSSGPRSSSTARSRSPDAAAAAR